MPSAPPRTGPPPAGLALYRALAAFLARPALARADRKLTRGGMPPARLAERRGRATLPRPGGRVIWIHGASVGESLSALPLVHRLAPRGFVLVTTGTATSAAILDRRLPEGAAHQFAPIDTRAAARAFLGHWRPDLAVFMESEIWPNLIAETAARSVPLALVNARMSERSLRNWERRAPRLARWLFSRFALVTAQDAATREGLERLCPGRDIPPPANLKAAIPPPAADASALADWQARLAGRPVWVASSTHPGEDAAVLDAHARVLEALPDALCILLPRHPERGPAIAELARARGLDTALRSAGEPVMPGTQVYVADTIGETGLWYRAAPLVFLAGSFGAAGGHNPWEPVALGAALLHGPNVPNAAADYAELGRVGAAQAVADAADLAIALRERLEDPARTAAMRTAARAASGRAEGLADDLAARLLALMEDG